MFGLGFQEIALILLLGVLLFGRKLPDIGRSIGKTVVEFKKGMKGVEDDLSTDSASSRPAIEPEAAVPSNSRHQPIRIARIKGHRTDRRGRLECRCATSHRVG